MTPDGAVIEYSREGEPSVYYEPLDIWFEAQEMQGLFMRVQVTRHAEVGSVELLLAMALPLYVDLGFDGYFGTDDYFCNVHGVADVERLDAAPGGIIEGTFEGETSNNCEEGPYQLRQGWFRLTIP